MSIMKISPEAMHETAHMFSIDNYHPLTAMFGRDETASGLGYTIYMVFENFEKRDMESHVQNIRSSSSLNSNDSS